MPDGLTMNVPLSSALYRRAVGPLLAVGGGLVACGAGLAGPPHDFGTLMVGGVGLAIAGLAAAPGHRMGWLAPSRVFLLGAALYLVPAVVTVLVVGAIAGGRETDPGVLGTGAALSLLGFGSAAVGIGLAELLLAPRPRRGGGRWQPNAFLVGAAVVGGLGVVAVGTFVFGIAGFSSLLSANYGERYQLMAGYGVLILGVLTVTIATLVGHVAALAAGRRGLAWAVALGGVAFQAGWTTLVGARTGFIQIVLGLLACRACLGLRPPGWKLVVVGSVLFVGGLLVGVTRAGVRSVADLDPALLLRVMNPANSEFGATIPTVGDVAEAVPGQEPYRWGATYLGAMGVLIPRAIWPARPQGAAEWYVARFYPDVADAGGAFAFSPVAEAYLNFGQWGVVVGFLLIGLLVGLVDRHLRHGGSPAQAIGYGICVYLLFVFSRLDSATVLKSYVLIPAAQVMVLYAVSRMVEFATAAPRPVGAR